MLKSGISVGNCLVIFVCFCNRVSCLAPPCGGKPKTIPRKLVKNRPRDPLPSSHYYLRPLSWTSRTFYFPDSRDILEVLRDCLGRERDPREDPLGPGRIPQYRRIEVFDLFRIRLRPFQPFYIRAASRAILVKSFANSYPNMFCCLLCACSNLPFSQAP